VAVVDADQQLLEEPAGDGLVQAPGALELSV
jgi:hypothetical protein